MDSGAISAAVSGLGWRYILGALRSAATYQLPRWPNGWQAQAGADDETLEIGIDAMDIASIRPFWKAVLGYADEPGKSGEQDALVDPRGQGPAIWFQQMDSPRPQRNRIHFDVSVAHDDAARRIEAALSAGGVLLSDARAPAFWVLADPEGNEACVTTWPGRD